MAEQLLSECRVALKDFRARSMALVRLRLLKVSVKGRGVLLIIFRICFCVWPCVGLPLEGLTENIRDPCGAFRPLLRRTRYQTQVAEVGRLRDSLPSSFRKHIDNMRSHDWLSIADECKLQWQSR